MRHFILIALALSFATSMEAAEGRRTAFMGGLVTGLVGGFLVRDAMEVKPQREVVYVESAPRVVYVEAAPVVVAPRPSVMYVYVEVVKPAPQVVYVERREVRAWQPPIAHPFPQ